LSTPIDTASVAIVPDFSGFAREVSRGIDAALRSVLSDVRQAFAQVERTAADAGREVGQDFQRGGETAERALREVATTATTSMAQVSASATTASASLSTRLAGAAAIAKGALLALGVAAGVGLAAIVGFGLKSAASIEQVQIGFEALLGSAQAAKSFMEELQSFAASTPFEFAGVADASRRILAFGQSVGIAKDEVIPVITTIGNLVSVLGGTQESVDAVVRAFGQIASKGRLMGGEILQIAEALPGFNANQAIASALGLSVADAMAAQEAGTVDATTAINALLVGMAQFPGAAGAMEKQAQTLLGVFSTFKDTISIALTNAFQPVIPEIKTALAELTPIIGEAVGELAPSLGGALSAILPVIGQLIKAIVPILTPILDALGPALDALGPSLVPLGEAIGQILVALSPILPLVAEFVGVLAILLVPVLQLLALVLRPLTPILQFLADSVALVGDELMKIDWAAIGAAIGGFFVDAWNKIKQFFSFIGKAFSEFPENVKIVFGLVRDRIVEKITEVIAFVQALPGRILQAIGDFGALLLQKGKDLIIGLWNGISGMGSWLWGKIKSFVQDNILGPVAQFLGISSPSTVFRDQIGKQITAGIGEGIGLGIPNLQSLISPIVPAANGGNSTSSSVVFGANSINVMFSGGTPTPAEAAQTGRQVGAGIAGALQRRNIGLAVRTT
jgi:tape measure domain-containing protein